MEPNGTERTAKGACALTRRNFLRMAAALTLVPKLKPKVLPELPATPVVYAKNVSVQRNLDRLRMDYPIPPYCDWNGVQLALISGIN